MIQSNESTHMQSSSRDLKIIDFNCKWKDNKKDKQPFFETPPPPSACKSPPARLELDGDNSTAIPPRIHSKQPRQQQQQQRQWIRILVETTTTMTTDLDKLLMMMTHTTEKAWSVNSVLNPSFLRSFLRLNYNALSLPDLSWSRGASFFPLPPSERHRKPWSGSRSKNRGNDAVVVRSVHKLINPNLKSSFPQAISRKKNTRGLIYDHQLHDLILEISLISYTDQKCEERDLQERERERERESLRDL